MASILPNGIRYYTKDTETRFSEVTLLIPVGENRENITNPECAHTCEHFACAFNGGFSRPYGFLKLRTKYGLQYHIQTHEDYTLFRVLSVPNEAIPDVCKFLTGVFVLNKPPREIANREIAIVHSELQTHDPIDRLYYQYLDWVRHQGGKPTIRSLDQSKGLSPEKVYQFHSQHYRPIHSFLCVRRPANMGTMWDRELLSTMTSTEAIMIPGRNYIKADCEECRIVEGTWVLPSKDSWGAIGVFFRGGPERSEVLSRSLISSATRLTGENTLDTMSITDYLRSHKGLSYSTRGRMVRIRDSHRKGVLAIIVFHLNRHLTRQEIQEMMYIVTKHCGKMPSRGDLSNMVARSVRSQMNADVSFLLKNAGIPLIPVMKWDMIHSVHKHYSPEKDRIGCVFSSPI